MTDVCYLSIPAVVCHLRNCPACLAGRSSISLAAVLAVNCTSSSRHSRVCRVNEMFGTSSLQIRHALSWSAGTGALAFSRALDNWVSSFCRSDETLSTRA